MQHNLPRNSPSFVLIFILFSILAFTQTSGTEGQSSQPAKSSKSMQASGMEDKLMGMEKTLWEAWKNKDSKPFEQHLTQDATEVNQNGVRERDEVLKNIAAGNCEVRSYTLDQPTVKRIGPDSMLLTYKATQDATCDGQKAPDTVMATSVWVKQKAKWLNSFHQETPATQAKQ
jgi:hypothetical protein